MNENSFENETFEGVQRPVDILFHNLTSNWTYIPESVFKSILDHDNGTIQLRNVYVNCENCQNHWLIRDRRSKQVQNVRCNGNKTNLTLFSPEIQSNLKIKCKINLIKNAH